MLCMYAEKEKSANKLAIQPTHIPQELTAKNNKLKCNTNALADIGISSICAPQAA